MDSSDFEFGYVICALKLIAFAIVAVFGSSEVKFCFTEKKLKNISKAKIYSVGSEDDLSGSFKGLSIIKGRILRKGQIQRMPILFNQLPFFLLFYKCIIFVLKRGSLRVITKRLRKKFS